MQERNRSAMTNFVVMGEGTMGPSIMDTLYAETGKGFYDYT